MGMLCTANVQRVLHNPIKGIYQRFSSYTVVSLNLQFDCEFNLKDPGNVVEMPIIDNAITEYNGDN